MKGFIIGWPPIILSLEGVAVVDSLLLDSNIASWSVWALPSKRILCLVWCDGPSSISSISPPRSFVSFDGLSILGQGIMARSKESLNLIPPYQVCEYPYLLNRYLLCEYVLHLKVPHISWPANAIELRAHGGIIITTIYNPCLPYPTLPYYLLPYL